MRFPFLAAGVLLGASLIVSPMTAPAAPLAGALSKDLLIQTEGNSLLLEVQHRRGGGHRGGGGRGGGDGGAVAAGIFGGMLLGAIIASEAQRQQSVSYCARRYRSYDPGSMTFVGRDGRRYRCP